MRCESGLHTSSKRWIIIWKWWLPVFIYFDFFMNVRFANIFSINCDKMKKTKKKQITRHLKRWEKKMAHAYKDTPENNMNGNWHPLLYVSTMLTASVPCCRSTLNVEINLISTIEVRYWKIHARTCGWKNWPQRHRLKEQLISHWLPCIRFYSSRTKR